MYAVLSLTLLLIAGFSAQVDAALSVTLGDCPNNLQTGDEWYLERCQKGVCYEDRYVVMSCGVYAMEYDTKACYAQTNMTANYPDCCVPKVLCIGDVGFDQDRLIG